MPRRPDTMETLQFALELLKRIPRHGRISAPELHEQLAGAGLDRDLHTIQRQLDMLVQHFDIERDDCCQRAAVRAAGRVQPRQVR